MQLKISLITNFWCIFRPEANGFIGCEFTVKFIEAGYAAVEPVINALETSSYQVHNLEANDSKFNLSVITLLRYTCVTQEKMFIDYLIDRFELRKVFQQQRL